MNSYQPHKTQSPWNPVRLMHKLAIALSVSTDTLVFDKDERGPDDDLRFQFEATQRFTAEEKRVVKTVIESILLSHEAKRWAA